MADPVDAKPDATAVRVALWRALHLRVDAQPHVIEDAVGVRLAAPEPGWEKRPDMDPSFTRTFRASIVARARFIEDLVVDESRRGVAQYVLLGAGLDTFAERRPEITSRLTVYEVDQPAAQAWKRQRLTEVGLGVPACLRLVPVNFESGMSWWTGLERAGFDASKPAVVASTGVSMYLSKHAVAATLRQVAKLARGSTFAMTFLLPIELMDPNERRGFEAAARGAQASGTPFVSYFTPEEIVGMASDAGFGNAECVLGGELSGRYFSGRTDGLRSTNSESFLVAKT